MALLTNINGKFSVSDAGAVTFNNAFTFPTADGTANYVLKTNGSGQLSWSPDNNNGDITGSGTANTVTKFTGAKTIGDGPITFSSNDSTFSGDVEIAANLFSTGQNLKFHAAGTHVMNIDINGKVYPNVNNAYDLGHSASLAWRNLYLSDSITAGGGATFAGNVGIGTATPQKKVHIEGTGGASEMQILVSSASDTVGHTAGIGLRGEGGEADGDLRIKGGIFFERIAGSFGNGKMILAVNSSVSNTSVTVADHALTIDTNKNVGIGTTSPSVKLEIFGNNSARNTLQNILAINGGTNSNNVYSGFGMGLVFNGRDYSNQPRDYAYIYGVQEASSTSTPGGDPGFTSQLTFYTNSGGAVNTLPTQKMVINALGNVGIGTDSPLVRLQLERTVSDSTSRTAPVNLIYLTSEHPSVGYTGFGTAITHYSRTYQNSTKTEQSKIVFTQQGDSVSTAGSTIDFYTKTLSTGSAAPEFRMRINYNGNVGIGTTSPAVKLDVRGEIAVAYNATYGLRFYNDARNNWSSIGNTITGSSSANLVFKDATGEVMRIATGKVGIGTDSPNRKLTVQSGSYSFPSGIDNNSFFTIAQNSWSGMTLLASTTTGSFIDFGDTDAGWRGRILYAHNGDYMYFSTAASEKMRITGAGNVLIGTTSIENPRGLAQALEIEAGSPVGIILNDSRDTYPMGIENAGAVMNFTYNTSPLMTILPNGNVGIGDTVPTSLSVNTSSLSVNSTRTDLSGALFQKSNGVLKFQQYWSTAGIVADVSSGDYFWKLANVNKMGLDTGTGALTVVGDVVAYGTPSDKQYKENIKPIESALDKAMKLQGVTFDWKKSDSILDIKEDIGFIAQDVQKVLPELVRKNENGKLSLRQQGITPILLEAIKELKAEIEELKKYKCDCKK